MDPKVLMNESVQYRHELEKTPVLEKPISTYGDGIQTRYKS